MKNDGNKKIIKTKLPAVDEKDGKLRGEEESVTVSTKGYPSPLRLLIIIAVSIFFAEVVIMFFLSILPPFSEPVVAFLDALLLSILVFPMLYLFLWKPIIMHINERKMVEEALKKSEEKYRAIFDQAADSILIFDPKTLKKVSFNENAYMRLGYTRKEFENIELSDIEVLEYDNEIPRYFKKDFEHGVIFETKHKTKDGRIRDVLVSANMIKIGDRNFIQGIWSDITEHKKMEKMKKANESNCY